MSRGDDLHFRNLGKVWHLVALNLFFVKARSLVLDLTWNLSYNRSLRTTRCYRQSNGIEALLSSKYF